MRSREPEAAARRGVRARPPGAGAPVDLANPGLCLGIGEFPSHPLVPRGRGSLGKRNGRQAPLWRTFRYTYLYMLCYSTTTPCISRPVQRPFPKNKKAKHFGAACHAKISHLRKKVFLPQTQNMWVTPLKKKKVDFVALRGALTTALRHVAAPRDLQALHMAYNEHDGNICHFNVFA